MFKDNYENYIYVLSLIVASIVIIGCSSNTKDSVAKLELIDNELQKSKWLDLKRFPAKYPFPAARKQQTGCATISYSINPEYQIENIKVVDFPIEYLYCLQRKL